MTISIWKRPQHGRPEVIDTATSKEEAAYLEYNYRMACACLPGQHRYGKDNVWAGRRDQEPKLSQAPVWA